MPPIARNPPPQPFALMRKAVIYFRVSTPRQGRSRLGLEAQEEAVTLYLRYNPMEIDRTFYEVESGAKNKRRVLRRAVRYCRKTGATLIFATVARLTRDAIYFATLIGSGIEVIAADKPLATKLDLIEDACRAQRERETTSKRTKDALAAAKRRGVILGKYGRYVLSKKNKDAADAFAHKHYPLIKQLRQEATLAETAQELNRRKVPTYRGKRYKWTIDTVYNLIRRIEREPKPNDNEEHLPNGIPPAGGGMPMHDPAISIVQQEGRPGGGTAGIENEQFRSDEQQREDMVDFRSYAHLLRFDWRHGFHGDTRIP